MVKIDKYDDTYSRQVGGITLYKTKMAKSKWSYKEIHKQDSRNDEDVLGLVLVLVFSQAVFGTIII